ncbi:MAG: hypothetical protein LC109_01500 [Bacteroidia bacterium]|nr:hypothetical protein [Bacteroidia bacterium]
MGKIRFFGAVILLSLIIQAANFGDAKSMFGDSAFTVFKMLNNENIPVEHNRYFGAIVNVPAYLGVKMDAPVSLIFQLYAVGPWLLMLGIFSLLIYLKRPIEALTLVITHVWFMRESFFITTEVPAAGAFALLYSVFLWWDKSMEVKFSWLPMVLCFLGVAGALFSHPIGLIFIVFLLGWKIVQSIDKVRRWWIYALPVVFIFSLKYFLFQSSSYEDSFFTKVFSDLTWVGNFNELYSVDFFFRAQNGIYILLIMFWIMGLFRLNTPDSRVAFFASLIGMPLLWVLVMVTFKDGDVNPMMEKSYLAIVLPVVYIFIFRTYQLFKGMGGLLFIAIWIISLGSISKIIQTGNDVFENRLEHLERLVKIQQRIGPDKFYVKREQIKDEIWLTHWALPFETLLMSLEKDGIGSLTVLDLSTRNSSELLPNQYYGPDWYGGWDVKSLNKKYFKLTPSDWVEIENLNYIKDK